MMTKTKFKSIISLYKNGVPEHTCILAMLQMNFRLVDGIILRELAKDIDKFYNITRNFPGTELEEV